MFVITQSCCSDATCVAVCPVNCIHPTPEERGFGSSEILHIDPEACIDCGACADACPVDAIYPADRLSGRDKVFIDINASYYCDNDDVTSGWSDIRYPTIPKLRDGMRVAIVGTGPSGGYALRTVLDRTTAQVTVIDRLPTPGGLVRAGVAPDHPGTKNVLKSFDLLYRDPRVSMVTNVEVGDGPGAVSPADLAEHFDAVFYCVGASDSRRLGIPGEDRPGFTSASELVAWYNAAPGAQSPIPARPHTSGRAVLVGTGNVALDVARILVSPPDLLATTDIADRALTLLREQNIHEVVLLGRRGAADAAYTAAEYLALQSIPGVDVVIHDDPTGSFDFSVPADPARRRIVFLFHSAPVAATGDDAVESLTVTTGARSHHVATDLVVRAIGYRAVPIAGLPFDEERGVFPTRDHRLLHDDETVRVGEYVIGWAKRGASGGIGTNKLDAVTTVEAFLDDAASGVLSAPTVPASAFATLLRARRATVIGYRGMRSIDRAERARGAREGRPRVKFTRMSDMVKAAGRRKA